MAVKIWVRVRGSTVAISSQPKEKLITTTAISKYRTPFKTYRYTAVETATQLKQPRLTTLTTLPTTRLAQFLRGVLWRTATDEERTIRSAALMFEGTLSPYYML
jgi:hypothetical protein